MDKEKFVSLIERPLNNRSIAPIKTEFLLKTSELKSAEIQACIKVEGQDCSKNSEEQPLDSNGTSSHSGYKLQPPEAKKARRGMNKRRPRDERIDPKSTLCFSFLENKCRFGDKCKFSHDTSSFWASKPADLGDLCPLFDLRGFCKFGLTCRYAKSHVDESLNNLKRENNGLSKIDRNSNEQLDGTNRLDVDLKICLQKRKYNFKESEDILGALLRDKKTGGICQTAEIPLNEKRVPKKLTSQDFKDKLYLAPLTTLGNLPFRRVCVGFGAEITCGEMALATELLQGNKSEWALMRRHPCEKIFGVQLCGGYPDTLTKCAQILTEKCDVDFVDLNVGCPIDLICDKGAGCSLMNKPRKLEQISLCMSRVLGDRPLTLKMRTGVNIGKNTAHSLMANLKDWKVTLCTVHGRSRDQRYTKLADWSYINECAKAAQPVPIFGCGDVLSFEDFYRGMEENSDVQGVMIARGALIKPWIFTEIKEKRHWDIRSSERLDILRDYVNFGFENWGTDQKGVDTTRRFLLEWLSFLHRYIPVGLLERLPQRMNDRPAPFFGRDDLETLMASNNCKDWVKLSEMLLGPVPDNFHFLPKHKANSYEGGWLA